MKEKGIEAITVKKVINNKTYYRTQAGVFSNKRHVEIQIKMLHNKGIKDSYFLTVKPLHIHGITSGSMYTQVLHQFGKPLKKEDHLNNRSLYYTNRGPGLIINFNMENGSLFGFQVYPEYLKSNTLPTNKQNIINLYGYPNEVKSASCYESATCEQLIYTFNGNKLIVQIDRDGKSVQFLDLRKLK